MQLNQLVQDTFSRDSMSSIKPFDLSLLGEAFQLSDAASLDLPPVRNSPSWGSHLVNTFWGSHLVNTFCFICLHPGGSHCVNTLCFICLALTMVLFLLSLGSPILRVLNLASLDFLANLFATFYVSLGLLIRYHLGAVLYSLRRVLLQFLGNLKVTLTTRKSIKSTRIKIKNARSTNIVIKIEVKRRTRRKGNIRMVVVMILVKTNQRNTVTRF